MSRLCQNPRRSATVWQLLLNVQGRPIREPAALIVCPAPGGSRIGGGDLGICTAWHHKKQQIVPFLKQELTQLAALKKNTVLSPLQKVEQLRQISSSVDDKITPLLDPPQQQKFKAIREENRRRLIEELMSKVEQKL